MGTHGPAAPAQGREVAEEWATYLHICVSLAHTM